MEKMKLKEIKDSINNPTETCISKIKLDKYGYGTITLTKTNDKAAQEIIFTGKEQVTDDFHDKFSEFKRTLVEIIPFLEEVKSENIKITGLTVKYGLNSELKGIVITAQVMAKSEIPSPVNINTPYVKFYDEDSKDSFYLRECNRYFVEDIIEKAQSYMDGDTKTKQLSLVVNNSEVYD